VLPLSNIITILKTHTVMCASLGQFQGVFGVLLLRAKELLDVMHFPIACLWLVIIGILMCWLLLCIPLLYLGGGSFFMMLLTTINLVILYTWNIEVMYIKKEGVKWVLYITGTNIHKHPLQALFLVYRSSIFHHLVYIIARFMVGCHLWCVLSWGAGRLC